jgi:two-component system response regulator YesN
MFKVILVDDEAPLRSLLRSLIAVVPDFHIVGEAGDGVEALARCRRCGPDIVITDVRMPGLDGLELMTQLAHSFPGVQVIVVSAYHEFAYAQRAIEHGAVGYLLKPVQEQDLERVLKKAQNVIAQRLAVRNQITSMKRELGKLQSSLSSPSANEIACGNPSPVIQKVLEYIQENYNRDVSLEEIAQKMYMNTSYLSRLFKQKTGKCFHDFLVEVRLTNARALLAKSELHVNEIAEMLGYKDPSHFISVFKRSTGMTPNDYRRHSRVAASTFS